MPSRNEIAAPAEAEHNTLYVAIEISGKSWVVGITGGRQRLTAMLIWTTRRSYSRILVTVWVRRRLEVVA